MATLVLFVRRDIHLILQLKTAYDWTPRVAQN